MRSLFACIFLNQCVQCLGLETMVQVDRSHYSPEFFSTKVCGVSWVGNYGAEGQITICQHFLNQRVWSVSGWKLWCRGTGQVWGMGSLFFSTNVCIVSRCCWTGQVCVLLQIINQSDNRKCWWSGVLTCSQVSQLKVPNVLSIRHTLEQGECTYK